MGKPDAFICELLAINTLASSTISFSSISTLHHKSIDNSVELVSLVRWDSRIFSRAQSAEVLCGNWDVIHEEFENDTTLLSNFRELGCTLNVKEDLIVRRVECGQLAHDFI